MDQTASHASGVSLFNENSFPVDEIMKSTRMMN